MYKLIKLQWPELHLDVFGQQKPVLLLEMSTLQKLELHLDVPTEAFGAPDLDVSKPQKPELHATGRVSTTETFAAPGHI